MTDTLVAEINRTNIHSLEVPDSFETAGSFVVELRNRGESTHVHLHLDDALSDVARLEANNHYVRADGTRRVHVEVTVAETETVTGQLKVVTAYGAETRYVRLSVDKSPPETVQVDPDLGKPQPRTDDVSLSTAFDFPLTVVSALGVAALGLAVGALVLADGFGVVLGVLAALSGMVAVGLLTVR